MQTDITISQILAADNALTLSRAKSLIGKKIVITSAEYKANAPRLEITTIGAILSEWEWAATQPSRDPRYTNLQHEWNILLPEENLNALNRRILLLNTAGEKIGTAEKNWLGIEPVFFGSDEDRWIYYLELDN